MTYETTTETRTDACEPSSTGETGCPPSDSWLKDVKAKLVQFEATAAEAKRLAALKTELEAFVPNQKAADKDYEKRYPELLKRWCIEHECLFGLHKALIAIPDWKQILVGCACAPQRAVQCDEQRLAARRRCAQGQNERALSNAKAAFDGTKARLQLLQQNAAAIDKQLKANDALIDQINKLRCGTDRAVALYLFWFKLLPAHRALAPAPLPAKCPSFPADETPDCLCKEQWEKPCEPEPGACKPASTGESATGSARRAAPWLLEPKAYAGELDCAFSDYRKAADAVDDATANFKAHPDDLTSMANALNAAKGKLDQDITDCLKKHAGDCCASPTPAA